MKCPKCRKPLRQQVSVFVDAPADCTGLGKKGLARTDVKIIGVGWDRATYYCQTCPYMLRLAKGTK